MNGKHTKAGRRASFLRHAIRSTKRLRPQRYRMSAAGWLVPVADDAPPVDDIRVGPASPEAIAQVRALLSPWTTAQKIAAGIVGIRSVTGQ